MAECNSLILMAISIFLAPLTPGQTGQSLEDIIQDLENELGSLYDEAAEEYEDVKGHGVKLYRYFSMMIRLNRN